ncbi:2-amino-4-hydroxy-6-hydroxymethyldihydropteridine diphosphokinase [Streptococcus dentiloxodontae]
MNQVYLSLGSNMGDRQDYLKKALAALDELPRTALVKVSSFYETAAWGMTNQADFLNLVCQIETELEPQDLLRHCQIIEKSLDRVRHEHWGPRTVDIDILIYGDRVIDEDNLKVPHPFMTERAFVLVPLLEIAEGLSNPTGEPSYSAALEKLDQTGVVLLKGYAK